MTDTKTVCPYCAVGCGLVLESQGNRVTGLRPDADHPVSRGTLCPKGATAHEFIHHPDRLTTPLVREGGTLRPTTWDAALDRTARELLRIRDAYGPDAVGVISSARATVEENYLAQKFARAVLGTNQVDNCYRICHSATVVGLGESLGAGAMTNSIDEFLAPGPKCILVVGNNTPHSHPIVWRVWMKPAVQAGAKLIIVDPRAPDLTKLAALHLPIRPGTEVLLFNAMAQHILALGLHDRAFVAERCEGFEALVASLGGQTPEAVAGRCGVPAASIKAAAELYARTKPASIVYGLGVTEHRTGVDNVQALANLALLTGNVGQPGTGINALRGQNNVQGATDMCRPETLPGYQSWDDAAAVKKFERAWGVRLPRPRPGDFLYCSRYWEEILEGGLKALYVIGSDPALTEGHASKVERALRELEFLAVHEVFPSSTTAFAHVVLPAASYAEKDGTFVSTERRVQRVRKAIEPVGESRPDWRILLDLAQRMGHPLGVAGPREAFDEMRRLVPSYAGVSYDRLDAAPGLQWPCPDEAHPGTATLHVGRFARGRARLATVSYVPPAEETDAAFPFLLTTGRGFLQYNSGTMTRRSRMEAGEPRCTVQVNPSDAARLGISDEDVVRVTSRRGSLEAAARLWPIKEGVVWMPFHYAEAPVNRLTLDVVDPRCGITELKVCAVRLSRVGPAPPPPERRAAPVRAP